MHTVGPAREILLMEDAVRSSLVDAFMSSELFTEYADVDDVLVYKIITPASYLKRCSANFSIQSNHDVVIITLLDLISAWREGEVGRSAWRSRKVFEVRSNLNVSLLESTKSKNASELILSHH